MHCVYNNVLARALKAEVYLFRFGLVGWILFAAFFVHSLFMLTS